MFGKSQRPCPLCAVKGRGEGTVVTGFVLGLAFGTVRGGMDDVEKLVCEDHLVRCEAEMNRQSAIFESFMKARS